MTPVCLMFFILMDITIGGLIVFMYQKGLEAQLVVALVMAGLAVISAALLIWYFLMMNQDEYLE
jgi:heme/copper-type cytochrome/quinol oxidase subunit 4